MYNCQEGDEYINTTAQQEQSNAIREDIKAVKGFKSITCLTFWSSNFSVHSDGFQRYKYTFCRLISLRFLYHR